MPNISAEKFIKAITYLMAIGRLQQAKEKAHDALRHYPDYSRLHSYLANIHYYLNESQAAIERAEQAVSRDPDDEWPYRILASVYADRGDYIKALQYANTALRLESESSLVHQLLARVHKDRKFLHLAKWHIEKAIVLDAADHNGYLLLGNICRDLSEFHRAKKAYAQGLALSPLDWRLHLGMGYCLENLSDHENSLKYFLQALKNNPGDDKLRLVLQDRFSTLLARHPEMPSQSVAAYFGPEFKLILKNISLPFDRINTVLNLLLIELLIVDALVLRLNWEHAPVRYITLVFALCYLAVVVVLLIAEKRQFTQATNALEDPGKQVDFASIYRRLRQKLVFLRRIKIVVIAVMLAVLTAVYAGRGLLW